MSASELSSVEYAKMKHALGLDASDRAYRNRYYTHRDGPDGEIWERLCRRGRAFKSAPRGRPRKGQRTPRLTHYWISKAGLDAFGLIDRSGLEGYELGLAP